jgi:hypothetical protein
VDKKNRSGDIEALLAIISREDMINVYSLADRLHWSYGKTERLVDQLVKRGMVHAAANVVNGRLVKQLSVHSLDVNRLPGSSNSDELKEAFMHLYGVFGELDASFSTRGLLAYCKKHDKTAGELKALFSRNLEKILQT